MASPKMRDVFKSSKGKSVKGTQVALDQVEEGWPEAIEELENAQDFDFFTAPTNDNWSEPSDELYAVHKRSNDKLVWYGGNENYWGELEGQDSDPWKDDDWKE